VHITSPVDAIAASLSEWEIPFPELDVFGTSDPEAIATMVVAFVRNHLGSGVQGYIFCTSSVGSTHGLVLEDGRRLVLKARPPPDTNPNLPLDRHSLEQVVRVQRYLCDKGYPCPAPIMDPAPLGQGLATIETYRGEGECRDAHDPSVRRVIARALYEHGRLLRPLAHEISLRHFAPPTDKLFPQPHSKLFHPLSEGPDIEWVLDLGRRARDLGESVRSEPILAHHDFRVEHLRFDGDRIVSTYDWDSVALRTEVDLVGGNAHGFTADWSQEKIRRVPTYEDILGFIADYEEVRAHTFTRSEHRAIRAWAAYWIAYGAWISIQPGDSGWDDDSWPALLADCGEKLLSAEA